MFSVEEEKCICVGIFLTLEGKLNFQKEEQGDGHCVDAM